MKLFSCILLSVISLHAQQRPVPPVSLDDLKIEATAVSQPVVYTNGVSGALFTETNGELHSSVRGWRVMGREMMKDYSFRFDNMPLQREDVIRVILYPNQFTRVYRNGLEETVIMLDSVDAFIVQLTHVHSKTATVYPLFSESHSDSDFTTGFDRNVMLIARKNRIGRSSKENSPAVLALTMTREIFYASGVYDTATIGENFAPAYISTVKDDSVHTIVVAVGDSGQHAYDLERLVAKNDTTYIDQQKIRTGRMITELLPVLDDAQARIAFAWGILGMHQLLLRESPANTFLNVPVTRDPKPLPVPGGGLLLGGRKESETYLRSLAALQNADSNHSSYGEILSRSVTSTTPASSLNITPWFTLMLEQYSAMTNDTIITKEIYPVIQRGIEGTLKFQVGKDYLLSPAITESQFHTLSPFELKKFGNEAANAAQALWCKQLEAGVRLARIAGDNHSKEQWSKILQKLYKTMKI